MHSNYVLIRSLLDLRLISALPSGNRANDEIWFATILDLRREFCVRELMREILLAGEEPNERSAKLCLVIPDGASERGIVALQGIQHSSLRHRAVYFHEHFAIDSRERSKANRQHDSNHRNV
jgi:hypothetical protein